jgi:hypothetical protein
MKRQIIKTDSYLLIVSNEEIKESDFIYETNFGEVSKVDKEYCELLKTGAKVEPFVKVSAHRPLNNAVYLDGVDVLPKIEDDVDKLADDICNRTTENFAIREVWKDGFNKAKETYKYTKRDIERAFHIGRANPSAFIPHNFDYYLNLIDKAKLPFAFDCEEYGVGNDENGRPVIEPRTITNSDGRTEWVGNYIFN